MAHVEGEAHEEDRDESEDAGDDKGGAGDWRSSRLIAAHQAKARAEAASTAKAAR